MQGLTGSTARYGMRFGMHPFSFLRQQPEAPETSPSKPDPKQTQVLVPPKTPVHFIHGTFSTPYMIQPAIDFFLSMKDQYPIYVSDLPEIRNATGIQKVDNPKKTMTADRAVLRELGDFRYQVVNNNIKALMALINNDNDPVPLDTHLAEFFGILPEERDLIYPIVKTHLVQPLFLRPDGFTDGDPLAILVDKRIKRLHKELGKLSLTPEEQQQPVFDSFFLKEKARTQRKRLNLDMDHPINSPKIINARIINLQDIAVLEAYLMFIELTLGKALFDGFNQTTSPSEQTPEAHRAALAKRAEKTAAKLMERIAPKSLVIGHSQGGTVQLLDFLNFLDKAPKNPLALESADSSAAEHLAARSIGVSLLINSPVSGIPPVPKWINPFISKIQNPDLASQVETHIWNTLNKGLPASEEMKAGSQVTETIKKKLSLAKDSGRTIISAYDTQDSFIEPVATRPPIPKGQRLPNVFHVPINLPGLDKSYWEQSHNILEEEFEKFRMELENPLLQFAFNVAEQTKYIPKPIQKEFAWFLTQFIGGLLHHRAPVDFPQEIRQELGKKLLTDPDRFKQLLDTSNFEPMRYQALVVQHKLLNRKINSRSPQDAANLLSRVLNNDPAFLSALINNARENLPVADSASQEARAILNDILDIIDQTLRTPQLCLWYGQSFETPLKSIAQAKLPRPGDNTPSPSDRAQKLLKDLSSPAN